MSLICRHCATSKCHADMVATDVFRFSHNICPVKIAVYRNVTMISGIQTHSGGQLKAQSEKLIVHELEVLIYNFD